MIEGLMIGLNRLSAEASKPVMSEIPDDPLSKMNAQQKSRGV
jgi:hypothetical protein